MLVLGIFVVSRVVASAPARWSSAEKTHEAEEDYGPNDGDDEAVDSEINDGSAAQQVEDEATDDGPDDADDNIHNAAVPLAQQCGGDPSGKAAEYDP